MTNNQWMQLYLQAWTKIHSPITNTFKHGVKFKHWDLMWSVVGSGLNGDYTFSRYILTWVPPKDGYISWTDEL